MAAVHLYDIHGFHVEGEQRKARILDELTDDILLARTAAKAITLRTRFRDLWPPMSAAFKVGGELFWGTNGAIEAYVEALGSLASGLHGREHEVARFFCDEREAFFMGTVVCLDPILKDAAGRAMLLDLLDAATERLLADGTFTDDGREWVSAVIPLLRAKIA